MFCWWLKGYKEKKIARICLMFSLVGVFWQLDFTQGCVLQAVPIRCIFMTLIYSEPQQLTPLKSLCFRWSKFRINFSPAHATPFIQQRLLVTWSCKVGFTWFGKGLLLLWYVTKCLSHQYLLMAETVLERWSSSLLLVQKVPVAPPSCRAVMSNTDQAKANVIPITSHQSHSVKPEDKPTGCKNVILQFILCFFKFFFLLWG